MLRITQRPLSKEERKKLSSKLPSFLFRKRREFGAQELTENVAEVLEFKVVRVWDVGGCRPPCCPRVYVFDVGDGQLVYAESWTALNYPEAQFPTSELVIVRSPRTKHVLSVTRAGNVLRTEPLSDPLIDYFDRNVECEVLDVSELPEEIRSLLNATIT